MNSYFKENIIEDINSQIVNAPYFEEWYDIVKDILINDEFQKRKLFPHHHNMSVWDHSILVSYKAFVFSKKHHADPIITAQSGLLHDFYENSWLYNEELAQIENGRHTKHMKVKKSLFKMHGFTHGKEASENYIKYFPNLKNKKITNSIKNHMFPLTICPPRYKEGWIVTYIDKMNSMKELPSTKTMIQRTTNKTYKKFHDKFKRKKIVNQMYNLQKQPTNNYKIII